MQFFSSGGRPYLFANTKMFIYFYLSSPYNIPGSNSRYLMLKPMHESRKRIALVSNTSWSLHNFRKGFLEYLVRSGYEVYCLAPEDNYSASLIRLGARYVHTDIDAKGKNPLKDIQYYKTLYKLYSDIQPDFIFHYTIKPNIYGSHAAKKLNIPSVAIISGAGLAFLKKNMLFLLVRYMYKLASGKASEVWFINKEDKQFFIQQSIVTESHTRILPGEGVNSGYFKRADCYSKLKDEAFNFLFSARLLWEKGIGYYVAAAERLKKEYPNVRFIIIGFLSEDGGQEAIDRNLIDAWVKDGAVEYLGALSDVKPLLDTIDCLVFPSYYPEGVPRVLLEAASMEIPIITTDNVGCREIVKHNVNGFLCQPRNAEDVYRYMKKMIEMPIEERCKMGQEGRRIILENYEESYVLEYYKSALQKYI